MMAQHSNGNGAEVVSLDPERLITVDELAPILHFEAKSLYNMLGRKSGHKFPIRVIRVGRQIRFSTRDIKAFLDSP